MHKLKISIIVPTLVRETLYPLLHKLLLQEISYNFEIIVIAQNIVDERMFKNEKLTIINQSKGKGLSYYRRQGIKNSNGEIIVFIDDDEEPISVNWLNSLVEPIISKGENIVTSGYRIKLNQGYFTDAISLLGFPGGGAIGFRTMWPVDERGYTSHICTGNLAIKKTVVSLIIPRDSQLKLYSEDLVLLDNILKNNIKIKYMDKATVYHVARSGLLNFIRWNIQRGRSAFEYKQNKKNITYNLKNRISSTLSIIMKTYRTKYMPAIIFFIINQYLWQTLGYLLQKYKIEN